MNKNYYVVIEICDQNKEYYYCYTSVVDCYTNLATINWKAGMPKAIVDSVTLAPTKKQAEEWAEMKNKSYKKQLIDWELVL